MQRSRFKEHARVETYFALIVCLLPLEKRWEIFFLNSSRVKRTITLFFLFVGLTGERGEKGDIGQMGKMGPVGDRGK